MIGICQTCRNAQTCRMSEKNTKSVMLQCSQFEDGITLTRGERFRRAREASGYSQAQASGKACVSRSTIEMLESEEYIDPKYSTVASLADIYGVDLRWLMGDRV